MLSHDCLKVMRLEGGIGACGARSDWKLKRSGSGMEWVEGRVERSFSWEEIEVVVP